MKLCKSAVTMSLFLVLSVIVAAPAAAEIDGPPTTSWGVDELLTGTQNDSLRSYVFAIEQVGDRIFVGGRFGDVTDGATTVDQPYLAAFDAVTGDWISSFTPTLDGSVNALQASPDGTRLFVGGDFSSVNGQSADTLVALDPVTGAVDNGFAVTLTSSNVVRDFDIDGQWLYIVGGFNGIVSPAGNNFAPRAVRVDWQTGSHDPNWRPMVEGGTPWGIAVSTADRVYLAGDFTVIDGNFVTGGYAAVTKTDATYVPPSEPFPINTQNVARQYLYDVEVVNGFIFVGGSEHFVAVLNEADQSLHRFHYSYSKGDYQDFEVVGDRVYAGCHCRADALIDSATSVMWFGAVPAGVTNGTPYVTNDNTWITAFSAVTGEVDGSFNPPITASRAGVWALHGSPDGCLWVGGDITGSDGQAADNLVRLCDPAVVDTERPSTPGRPQAINQTPTSVDLTWNPSTDNVAVTAYDIYNNNTNQVLATSTTPTLTINGLAAGDYNLYTRARDAAGNTSWRSGITTITIGEPIDTERPSTPGRPQIVTQDATSVDLTVNPSTDNVAVTAYDIYNNATGLVVGTSATNDITVSGLAAGDYAFYTRARDAAGNTSWRSGVTNITIGAATDTERPSTPTGLNVAAPGPTSVDLTWNPSTDNVAVTGYHVYDAATNQITTSVTDTTATLDGLAGNVSFYVKAFDAAGNTSWRSNIVVVSLG